MNRTQIIKQSVSSYLNSKKYQFIDLFYKMPCNNCVTINEWNDKFSFFPDILIYKDQVYYFCFILENNNKVEEVKKYIENHKFIKNFKIFNVEAKNLYLLKDEKYTLIHNNLKFYDETFLPKPKTFKSKTGEWEDKRRFGQLGEDKLIEFFNKINSNFIELNFNAPCDGCSNPEDWKKFNKLPDGIIVENEKYFFFDAKAKSNRKYIGQINFRDFKEYKEIQQKLNIDFKIYFLLFDYNKNLKEIYLQPLNVNKKINISKAWDGNKLINILDNNLIQLY